MKKDSLVPATLVQTEDGSFSLYCRESGECYHSRTGARLEAMSLYVQASGIQARWRELPAVSVLDVGLGLGYNALCTVESWMADSTAAAPLHITSFEKNPEIFADLRTAQGAWQVNWSQSWLQGVQCLAQVSTSNPLSGEVWHAQFAHPSQALVCEWTCVLGDIRETLFAHVPASRWAFIWYDPFSPKKAPELWTALWFSQLRTCVRPNATLVTYSVARAVRDAFSCAEWQWEKVPTDTGKRAWLRVHPTAPA